MKEVYVVIGRVNYEPGDILGIYTDIKLAKLRQFSVKEEYNSVRIETVSINEDVTVYC